MSSGLSVILECGMWMVVLARLVCNGRPDLPTDPMGVLKLLSFVRSAVVGSCPAVGDGRSGSPTGARRELALLGCNGLSEQMLSFCCLDPEGRGRSRGWRLRRVWSSC
jgi:hypothetical protein